MGNEQKLKDEKIISGNDKSLLDKINSRSIYNGGQDLVRVLKNSIRTETKILERKIKENELLIGDVKLDFAESVKNVKKEFEREKINMMEVISVFVAFFTFISIEINIFRIPLSLYTITGFSVLNLSFILFFVLCIQLVLRFENESSFTKKPQFYLFIGSILLSIIGSWCIYSGQSLDAKKIIFIDKENDKNKYIILDDIQLKSFTDNIYSSTTIEISILKKCINEPNIYNLYDLRKCLGEKKSAKI